MKTKLISGDEQDLVSIHKGKKRAEVSWSARYGPILAEYDASGAAQEGTGSDGFKTQAEAP